MRRTPLTTAPRRRCANRLIIHSPICLRARWPRVTLSSPNVETSSRNPIIIRPMFSLEAAVATAQPPSATLTLLTNRFPQSSPIPSSATWRRCDRTICLFLLDVEFQNVKASVATNCLKLNLSKAKETVFKRPRVQYFHVPPLLDDTEQLDCRKLLGVIFQSNFKMDSHIQFILSQSAQRPTQTSASSGSARCSTISYCML